MFFVQVIEKLYSHAAKLDRCQYISFSQLDFSVAMGLEVNNNGNIVNSLSGGLHKQQTKRKINQLTLYLLQIAIAFHISYHVCIQQSSVVAGFALIIQQHVCAAALNIFNAVIFWHLVKYQL